MKKNFISAIAGWKSAALLALVAMVAAVAFSGVLSTTQTADAALQSRAADGTFSSHDGNAQNGDTVYVQNSATTYVQFEIVTAGGASAAFTHGDASEDGQSLLCRDAEDDATGNCDADPAGSGVTVGVQIDNDSGKGVVFVRQTVVATDVTTSDEITVTVAQVPTTLSAKANASSIDAAGANAIPAEAGTTYIDIQLLDENNKGIASKDITIVSTRGLLSTAASPLDSRTITVGTLSEDAAIGAFTGASLAGTVTTSADAGTNDVDSAGYARVVVTGGGSPGISTITLTYLDLTTTVDIVLHGPVKTLSAELEQGAIEVGGMTRIVVTALDAGGNPVANQNVAVKTVGGVVPPERLATPVGTSNTVNKDGGTQGSLLDPGDLPACGDVTAVADDAGTEDVNEAVAGSTGTNGMGQCVIQVTAPDNAGTATDAARGTHTITLVASNDGSAGPRGVNEPSVDVQVGGAPATISSDAPDRIDPSDELTINVTVVDDEDVRVGSVTIEAIQTAGDGTIITPIAAKTSDGRAKFTYLAPSRPGVVEFLVRTRAANNAVTASLPIIVQIGEAPAEEPEGPAPTWNNDLVSGQNLVVWNGEDGADPSAGAADGVTAIWSYNTGSGSWDGYFPSAADVPGGNTLSSLSNGQAYVVIVE